MLESCNESRVRITRRHPLLAPLRLARPLPVEFQFSRVARAIGEQPARNNRRPLRESRRQSLDSILAVRRVEIV